MRILVFALLLVNSMALSQGVDEILEKANEQLSQNGLSVDLTYEVFESHKGVTKIEESQAKFSRFADGYFQRIGQISIIREDSLVLTLDHEAKELLLYKTNDPIADLSPIKLTSLPLENMSVDITDEGEYKRVVLSFGNSTLEVDKLILLVNSSNYYLKSMDLYFGNSFNEGHGNLMRIKFKNYITDNVRKPEAKISSYLKIEDDQITVIKEQFQTYIKRFNI